jgi:RNA polymerase subunit RPABC4/transcription elongation factor Spt4
MIEVWWQFRSRRVLSDGNVKVWCLLPVTLILRILLVWVWVKPFEVAKNLAASHQRYSDVTDDLLSFPAREVIMEPRASYRLCPKCARAVPNDSEERYCINDGARLLEACLGCGASITSPYARFCPVCGTEYRANHAVLHEVERE